ncbi:MAG: hypothetical protein ACRBBP_04570 [Bdellovibrionales bacterium]
MTGMKITNPLRFFGFFGLFLVFMFLAVKSCSDRKSEMEFVNADNITDVAESEVTKENSKEHEKFIKDVKKDIKKQDKFEKKLSAKDVEKLEDKNANRTTLKKLTGKAVKIKKDTVKKVLKKAPKVRKESKWSGSTVLVKGEGTRVDNFSKLQLQKDVKAINKIGKGKVTIYGSYFPGEQKSKGFVRAANIKNELIRFGLKNSISVFILPESRKTRGHTGRVKFSK